MKFKIEVPNVTSEDAKTEIENAFKNDKKEVKSVYDLENKKLTLETDEPSYEILAKLKSMGFSGNII
jgi:uncharacterized protein YajQ (UPF0234 family)